MPASDTQQFSGFTPAILESLLTPGVAERWQAVQERLHPAFVALAEALRQQAARQLPRVWPLYDITFKSLPYINRGSGERAPIDEYHLAIDRPPRGAGVYLAVSGAERRIIVALQLWRARKADLRAVWEDQQISWAPLVSSLTDVRFAERRSTRRELAESAGRPGPQLWMDRYLEGRGSDYLLAGFSYSWDDPQVQQPAFAQVLLDHILALLPLNEAIMEQAEALDPAAAAWLRESRLPYAAPNVPIETIVARIQGRGFALSDTLIRAYHIALQTKPLVILPGISGTGKTRLTRLYADAIYADSLLPGQENEHYLLVAVQPDWHNARDLLGYYNAITGKFHPTPFLRFLARANADPAASYYVCLDEMNLARPEYYLAPLLSALETDSRLIDLGASGETVETVTGETLPNPFRLPLNVHLIGTVNVDESTHPLSDKLLDRANVIELTEVDLPAFRERYRGPIDEAAWALLVQIHGILTRAGQPFGYRTIAEILRYLERAQGVLSPTQALDQQIKQKLLPKLRGEDSPRLRRALVALLELLLGQPQSVWKRAGELDAELLAAAPFPSSAEKVRAMLERLDTEGYTSFSG